MRKIKKHENRLSVKNKRFPWSVVLKIAGENASCKCCGRTPLVGRFDMMRTIDGKNEAMCLECYQAGRAEESGLVSLARAMSGMRENEDFPLEPKEGTSHREKVGRDCTTCGKPIYWNPYKKKLIGAYNELLRGVTVHEKCGVPR